jgi:putative SOS response-associated peptidase YedK
MCGRFAMTLPPEAVRAFFAYAEQPNFPPRYNIAPTQPIPIVMARAHTGGRERHFLLARWGFLPAFVKDPRDFPLLINARAETLAQKPSYRAALKRRRCLVIADGFYEWRREAAGAAKTAAKTPFLVRRVDRAPMGFAGLMETWSDPSGGEIDTACIITTAANRLMRRVHDRMPAILSPEAFSLWLDNDGVDPASATALLRPAPEPALELIPIGAAVNRTANDDAATQTPIGEAIRAAPPEKAR